jgi:putative flippase GtrA
MENLVRQFSMFSIMGGISTLAHYIVLILLVQLVGISSVLASMAGYAIGAVVNYRLNYSLTFVSQRDHREAFWRFLAIAASGFALNGAIMLFGINSLRLHYLLAQVAATIIVLILNFMANRFWTFAE